jgi:hypothetical protein
MVRGGNVVSTGGADSVSLSLQNATGGAITITAISVDGTASGFKNDSGSAASLNGTLITSVPTVPIKVAAGGRMNFAAIDAPASGQLNGTITITFTTSTGYSKTAVIRASGRLGAAGAAGGGAPCGNNNIEGTEVCDGTALGGRTCITLGFSGGTPSCSADCASFNTSLCYLCGNGTCESSKGENYSNCYADCHCGDGFCDPAVGENSSSCGSDCGASVFFSHSDWGSEQDCVYPIGKGAPVCLTRGSQQGLYNSSSEGSFSWGSSPAGTLWYAGACGASPENNSYTDWLSAVNSHPPGSVGQTYCVYLEPPVNQYHEITFNSWTIGPRACGGGFSYTRTPAGGGTPFSFSKSAFGSESDCITGSVCITRGTMQGLYNPVSENSYSWNFSPSDTEWANVACGADPESLSYTDWRNAAGGSGNLRWNIVGMPMCLHLISDNLYFDIVFDSWVAPGSGLPECSPGGGGFSYTRVKIKG